MVAATVTNEEWSKDNGQDCYTFQTTTAANGEDGVTVKMDWSEVTHIDVNGFEDGASGPFYGYESSGTVTIKALAGSPGDAKAVSVKVYGHN